jgi:hypothetical protein
MFSPPDIMISNNNLMAEITNNPDFDTINFDGGHKLMKMKGKELLSGSYIEETKKFNYIINPDEYYLIKFINYNHIKNIFKIPAVNSFNINRSELPYSNDYLDKAYVINFTDGIVSELGGGSIYNGGIRMNPTKKYLLNIRDIGKFIVRKNHNGDIFFENESGIQPSIIKNGRYVVLYIGDV